MKALPRDPTPEMIDAGIRALGNHIKDVLAANPGMGRNRKGHPRGLVIGPRQKMAIRYQAMWDAFQAGQQ